MADKEATLIVRLKDEFTSGLNALQGKLASLKASFLAVIAVVASVAATIYESVKAYAENEEAVNKLNAALLKQGITSNAVSLDLQAYAQELQRVTTFSDETILRAQALMVTFGMTGEVLKKSTKAAMDMSTVLGVDLQTAALLLGKAYAGNTQMLQRYGIVVDQSKDKHKQFEQVIAQIEARMGGSASAAAATFNGRVLILKNQFDELKESIGKGFMPVAEWFIGRMMQGVTAVQTLTGAFGGFGGILAVTIEAMRSFLNLVIDAAQRLPGIGKLFPESWQKNVNDTIDGSLAKLQQLHAEAAKPLPATIQAGGVAPGAAFEPPDQSAAKEAEKWRKETEAMLQGLATKEDAKAALSTIYEDAEIARLQMLLSNKEQMDLAANIKAQERLGNFAKAKELKEQAMKAASVKYKEEEVKLLQKLDEERKKNFQDTLNFISTLSESKNKELAAVGKAAAVSMAVMKTYEAANVALASAPPPWNFALVAAVVAAGLANVSKIVGVQLAQGGIVQPTAGGTLATIGEAGHAEAVIPLDDPRARDTLGGLGQTTININAGVIVADRASVQQFAEMIDAELYDLQRRGRSVSS